MEALNLQQMVSSQLIPSDVELPYGSIWRKSNNCLKRTIVVSMYVVVVCGVMSLKSPCPGINSIENKEETNYLSDDDEVTVDIPIVGCIRSGTHAPRRLIFLPPLRLKRHVAVPGNCYNCGIRTSESAVRWTLYYCYECADKL